MVKKQYGLLTSALAVVLTLSLCPVARGEELGDEVVEGVAASEVIEPSEEADEGAVSDEDAAIDEDAVSDEGVASDEEAGTSEEGSQTDGDVPVSQATEPADDGSDETMPAEEQPAPSDPAVDDATSPAVEEAPAADEGSDDEAASTEEVPVAETSEVPVTEAGERPQQNEPEQPKAEKTTKKKAETELKAQATEVKKSGWVTEKVGKLTGYTYYVGGKKVTGYRSIGGKGYFFDEATGLMQSSCAKVVSNKLRLFGTDGIMLNGSGWKQVGSSWYYLKSSVVSTGWLSHGGAWYYLDEVTGVMKSAEAFDVAGSTYLAETSGACPANVWVKLGKTWYHTDGSCAVRKGWFLGGAGWYYLDAKTGAMKESTLFKVSGVTYVADASGLCPDNAWVKLNNTWYYTNSSCAVRKGWASYGGDWYYLDPSTGAMYASKAFIAGGKTYVADASGVCPVSSWAKVGSAWYLTNSSCAARTGWAMDGGTWYYLSPQADKEGIKGKMVTGLHTISGKRYYFFSSGAMAANRFVKLSDGSEAYAASDGSLGAYRKNGVYYNADGSKASGWIRNGNDWMYIDSATGKPKTGWLDLGGTWYYLDSNGIMVTGERTIGGKTYYFQSDGRWIDISSVGAAVVKAAYSQIGAAYTEANDYYEANVAFNCSGFSYWCYLQAGYTIPRKQGYYSYYWNENNMEYSQMWWVEKRGNWRTDVADLRPGDLVFFSPVGDKYRTGHVGVYVGDSMMIDAFPGYGVSKRSVYQSGFVGGGNPLY